MRRTAILAVFVFLCCEALAGAVTGRQQTHLVRRGQHLQWIATHHNVGWESMLLVNERFLQTKYDQVCGELSRSFRHRRGDRGPRKGGKFYCNDRFSRPYGNTLRPGWRLAIPTDRAPTSVVQAVSRIKGNRIALVIDDTGSMNDDRERVSSFYFAAIRSYGKRLAGVWLYADGRVRKYEAGGVRFLGAGEVENTYSALTIAARSRPDAIVLVTDEPGDDWNWSSTQSLPPVVAHCLDEGGDRSCKENLQRLARVTRGSYMTGVN